MKGDLKSHQIDKKLTMQVRIDSGLHRLLKIKASEERTSIRTLIEGCLAELLEVKSEA